MRVFLSILFGFFRVVTAAHSARSARAGARARASFGIGAAYAFLTAFLRLIDIERSKPHNKNQNRNNNNVFYHNFTSIYLLTEAFSPLRAYSSLSCFSFLMISTVRITATRATKAQPSTGIQAEPKSRVVKSVPKKNTRKPSV